MLIMIHVHFLTITFRRPRDQKHSAAQFSSVQWMHLAVVACGDRLLETLNMLKSAVLFSNKKLKFHIFAEDSLKPEFEKKVSLFQWFLCLKTTAKPQICLKDYSSVRKLVSPKLMVAVLLLLISALISTWLEDIWIAFSTPIKAPYQEC